MNVLANGGASPSDAERTRGVVGPRQMAAQAFGGGTPGLMVADSPRESLLQDLSTALFAVLPRRDQRHKGEQYLRGLLSAHGRRSIRNVALSLGDPTMEQPLHHFVCNSTWDWVSLREALSDWLVPRIGARAWVVRPMPIPKSGQHSVGVGWGVDEHHGGAFHGQQAFGVWAASERVSAPVTWRLLLDDDRTEPRQACAATAALGFSRVHDATRLPVVLDTMAEDPSATLDRFSAAGVPVLVRVPGTTRVTPRDARVRRPGQGQVRVQQLLASVPGLRRTVAWGGTAAPSGIRHTPVARLSVGLPGSAQDLVLLGEWDSYRSRFGGAWLTTMTQTPSPALLRLAALTGRVRQDLAGFGNRAGLRDFEGRSLRGWHCHITLASAAHAVEALTAQADGDCAHLPGMSA
ncbi:transposase [Streptomyces sp. R1]|uniref:IS701 family transposase n=1 Tax=Streptomyces sp. R1 TaxID=1509279 RepID=UPI001E565955|nr:transposase [Streptomyces sp. R1]MCC8341041.1 transposase [Streptomyces sp. R1]